MAGWRFQTPSLNQKIKLKGEPALQISIASSVCHISFLLYILAEEELHYGFIFLHNTLENVWNTAPENNTEMQNFAVACLQTHPFSI